MSVEKGQIDPSLSIIGVDESIQLDVDQKMDIVHAVLEACAKKDDFKPYSNDRELIINRVVHLTKLPESRIINLLNQKPVKMLPESNIKNSQLDEDEKPELMLQLRQILFEKYVVSNKIPTMNTLKLELGNLTTPNQLEQDIKNCGYIWKRLDRTKKSIIIEDPKQAVLRQRYLKQIIRYREQNYHIVYIEEKITDSNIDQGKSAMEGTVDPYNALVEFIAVSSKYGYLDSERHETYMVSRIHASILNHELEDFLTKKVVPKLRILISEDVLVHAPTVFVLQDNAYHYQNLAIPTMHSSKADMIKWLKVNGIPFEKGYHRAELFQLIDKSKNKLFAIPGLDNILQGLGYSVLRRPRKCQYLNIFQTLWEDFSRKDTDAPNQPKILKTSDEIIVYLKNKNMPVEYWQKLERDLICVETKVFSEDMKFEEVIDKILTMAKYGDVSPWAHECDDVDDSQQLAEIFVEEECYYN